MTYDERIKNVTIIGAAGKMGSGIVLLTALEMADTSLKPENKDQKYILNALDLNKDALEGLLEYLKTQVEKIAYKKISFLKSLYPNIIDDNEVVNKYVKYVLSIVNIVSDMNVAANSTMIFEAAVENPDIKISIFKELEKINTNKAWYFTNTSSIPIHILNDNANLEGRIVGFHFYNPPAIQKLVELIPANKTQEEVLEFAKTYANKLRKVVVLSSDVAAFIGNGHFTRDIIYASERVDNLSKETSIPEAIYIMNKISKEYLVRPMGIFQLCDYVGINVCHNILKVMEENIENENLICPLLAKYFDIKILGGQNSDGTQKDGILKYEKGKPSAIYDYTIDKYVEIADFKDKCDKLLGESPSNLKWKDVIASPEKNEILEAHFKAMHQSNTFGAVLTLAYGEEANEIGIQLVNQGVAKTVEDVNIAMKTGFFHAYGPINKFFN